MNHSFDVDIAVEYGVNSAILLQNISYWIQKNKANEAHFYDGCYWTYNSVKAFKEMFPYMTEKQIRTTLERLESDDLVKTGNYNKLPFDRTKWYALTEKGESLCLTGHSQLPHRANDTCPTGQTNTRYKTDINTNINSVCAKEQKSLDFDSWYSHYPKKKSRGDAEKAWKAIKPTQDLIQRMIDATETMKAKEAWTKDNGQYIPYPATWLRAKGWEDEEAQPPKRIKRIIHKTGGNSVIDNIFRDSVVLETREV